MREELMHKAAQLWCLPQHGKKVMDTDFAMSIAEALQSAHDAGAAQAFEAVESQWVGSCYSSGLPCGCKDDAVKAARESLKVPAHPDLAERYRKALENSLAEMESDLVYRDDSADHDGHDDDVEDPDDCMKCLTRQRIDEIRAALHPRRALAAEAALAAYERMAGDCDCGPACDKAKGTAHRAIREMREAESKLAECRDNSATNWANWRKAEAALAARDEALTKWREGVEMAEFVVRGGDKDGALQVLRALLSSGGK